MCSDGELPKGPARQQDQRQEVLGIFMTPAQIDGTAFSEAITQNIRGNSERTEFCKRSRCDGKCPERRGTQRRLPGAVGDSVQSGMTFIYLFIHSPICSFPCLTNTQVLQLVSQRMLTYKSEMDSEGDRALPSWEGYSSRTEQAWSGSLTELQTPLVVRLEPFLTPSQVV